jgi:hypothetical protein
VEYSPQECYDRFKENGQLIEKEIEEKIKEVTMKLQ